MQIMAVEYAKGRYFREAAAVAERALSVKGDDVSIWLLAIKSWQDAGDHRSALRLSQQMISRFPDNPRAAFEHGYELYHAGRREEAMPFIQKSMAASPPWEEPFFFMGDILLKDNRAEQAVPVLRKALELRPDYSAAALALGRALIALGRDKEAEQELLRAVQADPRNAQPHLLLSQLYFRRGDEAAAAREKALSQKLRSENPGALEGAQSRPFPDSPAAAERRE
jgi:tetratricopeptide (TPR) repeat protein